MAIYAVGDLQGCYDQLRRLLDKVHFDTAIDRLWCVGDMVNRGNQSLETLRFLKSLGTAYTGVLGNHDLHFMALATGAYTQGKKKKLQALLDAPDCGELCEWLRHFPLVHSEKVFTEQGEKKYLMVHAGIPPGWKFKQARTLSAEVENMLRSEQYTEFLYYMYGDKPDIWHDDLSGMERLRVITNYLTRMRFCNQETQLNLAIKTGIKTAPEGFLPWFEFKNLKENQEIVFGHWATLDGVTNKNNIHALDTGCVWGRELTVMRLEDKKRFSISCEELGVRT